MPLGTSDYNSTYKLISMSLTDDGMGNETEVEVDVFGSVPCYLVSIAAKEETLDEKKQHKAMKILFTNKAASNFTTDNWIKIGSVNYDILDIAVQNQPLKITIRER